MTTIAQKYRELLSLSQTHILDEYESKEWLLTDPETFSFYQQNITQKPPPPTKQRPKLSHHQAKPLTPPIAQYQPPVTKPQDETPAPPTETKTKSILKLEPLTAPTTPDFGPIKKMIQQNAPDINIVETPDDTQAKKIGQHWKKTSKHPEVIILSFEEELDERIFLNNVSKAIDLYLAPTMIYSAQKIEQQQAWPQIFNVKELKLIITTDHAMYTLPGLMQHYRESPNKNQRYLGGIPAVLLTNIKFYMQQPNLKQALWKAVNASLGVPSNNLH